MTIDIIIAIYNTPLKDLERCLNSIKNQTYKKWNALLIDDGSNEETKKWLDTWSKKNKKFKVYHKKNEGVSIARNYGLKASNAEYIMFSDSDDTITTNCFEEAINIIKKYDVDMVVGGTAIIYKKYTNNRCSKSDLIYKNNEIKELLQYTISGHSQKKDEKLNNILLGRIYPKMYKKELLKDVIFDSELTMHEDNLFSINVLEKCKKIYITKNIWYNYYQNDYSITHIKYSDKLLMQELIFLDKIIKCMKKYDDCDIINSFKLRIINIEIMYLERLIYSDKNLNKEINAVINNKKFNNVYGLDYKKYKNIKSSKKIIYNILLIKNKKIKSLLLKIILNLLKIVKR